MACTAVLRLKLLGASLLVPAASVSDLGGAALCRQPSRAAVALDEARTGGPGGAVSMVQLKRASLRVEPMDEASQAERLSRAYPIAWVHPPKSGSSILNFMVHLPGTCPGIPNDTVVSVAEYGEHFNGAFRNRWNTVTPDGSGSCEDHFFKWGNHLGAGPDWDTHYKGRAFAMFRQPEQRLLSAYRYNYHSWPRKLPPHDELEMAQELQGCAVRTLTRGGIQPAESCAGVPGGPATEEEVAVASQRLRADFAFVGLTDYWVLSMCLGHRMFGGSCRESDFMADRVTNRREGETYDAQRFKPHSRDALQLQPKPYDTAPLKGFRDPYDGALYEVAQEVFQQELRLYNASLESCRPCFEEAGISELVTPEMEFVPSV